MQSPQFCPDCTFASFCESDSLPHDNGVIMLCCKLCEPKAIPNKELWLPDYVKAKYVPGVLGEVLVCCQPPPEIGRICWVRSTIAFRSLRLVSGAVLGILCSKVYNNADVSTPSCVRLAECVNGFETTILPELRGSLNHRGKKLPKDW